MRYCGVARSETLMISSRIMVIMVAMTMMMIVMIRLFVYALTQQLQGLLKINNKTQKYRSLIPISRYQWRRGLRRRSAAERLLGSWVRILLGGGMDVCLLWVFVLSGRGLWYGPIPRPEESYRLWCVSECDQVQIYNLDTCCEQVGRRGKDCETKRIPIIYKKVTKQKIKGNGMQFC
jgi:hypothetical protein